MNSPLSGTGYRFVPTEQELLFFLKNRAMGYSIPPNCGIVEKDLYVDSPWMVFNADVDDPWQLVVECLSGRVSPNAALIYVITKLRKVGNGEKNKIRTAGCGTWHATTKPRSIENSGGEIIGTVRSLNFTSRTEMRGHWIMHEYALSGVSLGPQVSTDYVICRITRRADDDRGGSSNLKGSGKRKATVGDRENQASTFSDKGENQRLTKKNRGSKSSGDRDGDDFDDWLLNSLEFDTCEREIGADQLSQNCVSAPVDNVPDSGVYSSIIHHLFAEEDSRSLSNFPREVVDTYLVSCLG